MRAVIKAQLLARVKDERAASEAFFRWAFRHSSGGTAYDRLSDAVRDGMLANGAANMAELGVATGEHLTRERVAGIACPVVCVSGELSDQALLRATDYIVALIPNAQVKRIAGAGHAMHLERPAAFAGAVRDAVPAS